MLRKRRFLPASLGVLFAIAGLPQFVFAGEEQVIEEVIVTGSRIARSAGSYVGPMTTLIGDTVRDQANYSLNDSLLKLPSIGAQGTARNNSNGGRGANFSGIHQLAPERTLTMYDGRRHVSTIQSTLGLGVDLQGFPVNMIDRVEILADGASAVYGSDAIAGVINLIPLKNFNGFELSLGAGTPQDDGGDHLDYGAVLGVSGDAGFFTAAVTFVKDDDVDYQDRDFSKIPLLGSLDLGGGTVLNLVGSGIPPEGRHPNAGIIFKPDPATGLSYTPYDTFCETTDQGGDASLSIQCILNQGIRFNYNDIPTGISLINENKSINFGMVGEYELEAGATVYLHANLAHREGTLNFTPLPIADAAGKFTTLIQVPYTNPNIPADAFDFLVAADHLALTDTDGDGVIDTPALGCADVLDVLTCPFTATQMWWRGLDLGPRVFDYDSDTLQATLGIKGDFSFADRDWSYDVWYTGGRSELFEVTKDQINVQKLTNAVDPVLCAADSECPKDALGNPTLDIFGRGAKSDQEKSYLLFDDQERTDYDMYHFAATLAGDIFEAPAGPVGFSAGVEYRKEKGGVQTSGVVQAGDSGGNFAEPTKGDYDVKEVFAEFSIPLLGGQSFAEELTLDVAGRFSDYDTFGSKGTYKLSLGWAPLEQVRFRGVISTGYRAPNILELFGGVADNFLTVSDPCIASAQAADANRLANCAADGVGPGFIQNASQLKISAGGNPGLDAEESDTWSVGFVWHAEFADLRVALDWYDVEITDAIGTPDPVTVITTCYDSPGGTLSAPECARIGRGPTGSVVRFDLLNENLAKIETRGLDLDATYMLDTEFGSFQFNWLLNYLDEYVETSETGVVSDRTGMVAGLVSDWAAYPDYRSNFTTKFSRDEWSVSLSWRYLDEMDVFDVIEFDNVHTKADAVNYFDLHGTYNINAWSLHAGIENLTDEEPPYVTDVSANTSGIYDFLGRVYFARATWSLQ